MNILFPRSHEACKKSLELLDVNSIEFFYKQRIKEWRSPFISVECGTLGTFDDFINSISPNEAFNVIPIALNIAKYWMGGSQELFVTALSFLGSVSRASETTEQPKELLESWGILKSHIDSQDLQNSLEWKNLCDWYRK